MRHEVAPVLDRLEQKDWALARRLVEAVRRARSARDRCPRGVGRRRARQGRVDRRRRGGRAGRVVRDHVRGAIRAGDHAAALLRDGGSAAAQYVPRLVTGELIGAYALSESGSGSDALGAKARATRQPDGSFSLSGEKMWITNGGFADLFIVFAKVDGEQFTAFIVERAFAGVSTGKEEHKTGAARLVDHAADPAGRDRCRPARCWARSARATRSPSTC